MAKTEPKESIEIDVVGNSLHLSMKDGPRTRGIKISLVRTLRIPDDDKIYPLPAGLGMFPIKRVEDYKEKVPKSWLEHGGVFFPMWQREAMWMSFGQDVSCPFAMKVAAGKINAISGETWTKELKAKNGDIQDYAVSPPQAWIDGFNVGKEVIRQFVSMPLGMGYTVEGQITGKEEFGGIQIQVYPIKKEHRKDPSSSGILRGMTLTGGAGGMTSGAGGVINYGGEVPTSGMALVSETSVNGAYMYSAGSIEGLERGISTKALKSAEMGLASGGRITQKIYEDPHGVDSWNQDIEGGKIFIHIVNSEMWKQITGEVNPPSPISKEAYKTHGIPWFGMYDEGVPAVEGSTKLAGTKSVSEKDKEHNFSGQMDNESLEAVPSVKIPVKMSEVQNKTKVKDGSW